MSVVVGDGVGVVGVDVRLVFIVVLAIIIRNLPLVGGHRHTVYLYHIGKKTQYA